jgi:hypothetical protein
MKTGSTMELITGLRMMICLQKKREKMRQQQQQKKNKNKTIYNVYRNK